MPVTVERLSPAGVGERRHLLRAPFQPRPFGEHRQRALDGRREIVDRNGRQRLPLAAQEAVHVAAIFARQRIVLIFGMALQADEQIGRASCRERV